MTAGVRMAAIVQDEYGAAREDGLDARRDAELLEDVVHVHLQRLLADEEAPRDLGVVETVRHQVQHLVLARRQELESLRARWLPAHGWDTRPRPRTVVAT